MSEPLAHLEEMSNTFKNIFVHIYSLHSCLVAFSVLNWPALSKKIRFTKKSVGFSLVFLSSSYFADDYTRRGRSRDVFMTIPVW